MAGWLSVVPAYVQWGELGAMALFGFNVMRHMNGMLAMIGDEIYEYGERIRNRAMKTSVRAMGIWLTSIGVYTLTAGLYAVSAPLILGAIMTWKPRILLPAFGFLVDAEDYDKPIGPAPDPTPHLRTPEALEEWLGEG